MKSIRYRNFDTRHAVPVPFEVADVVARRHEDRVSRLIFTETNANGDSEDRSN